MCIASSLVNKRKVIVNKQRNLSLTQLCRIYFKIGSQAYGGWSTTYLLLEKEFASKRKLLSKEQLRTAMAAGQALPGPAQVIVAAQAAYFLKGVKGSLLATIIYLVPSLTLTLLFCFIYFNYFAQSHIANYTIGIQAAVGGIIIGNAYKIARHNASSPMPWIAAGIAGILYYTGYVPTLAIIFGFAIAGIVIHAVNSRKNHG